MTLLHHAIQDAVATLHSVASLEQPLNRAAEIVLRALASGRKLLVCGNGGSASDATHMATEFLCCFLGRDGGFTKGAATIDLLVPGNNTARIQEAHKLLFHVLCEMVDAKLPK
jgi:phosphoheptose isomerase